MDTVNFVAGLAGGFASTIVVHPLDLLKIRSAVHEGNTKLRPSRNYLQSAILIVRKQSILGLYQGVVPNLLGSTISWGLYFWFYNVFNDLMKLRTEDNRLTPMHRIVAGMLAGKCSLTLTFTNPIWIAKTRLCLQYENRTKVYNGMFDVLLKVFRQHGIRGLYKGYLPGLFGTSHGALQFMAYDELKIKFGTTESKPSEHILFAALSKTFAVSATYPYQVVRLRLQDQHATYGGIGDVISKLWRYEGIIGFYKGMLPSILRVTPATCVTFVVFEWVSRHLKNRRAKLCK